MPVTASSFPRDDVLSLWQAQRHPFLRTFDSQTTYRRSGRRRTKARSIRRRALLGESDRIRLKRVFDLLAASAALLFLAPVLIAIVVAIKSTSPGPVFFRQRRYGYRNHRFHIYKFRTMYAHLGDRAGTRQVTRGDPRVTPVGRFLRSTSLDELPQLFNVLKGDMSLVGPRPHVPGMLAAGIPYEDLVPYYFQRHTVRPGITGLAQVNGCRGSTERASHAIARVDYDLDYIERWSLWMDFKIVLKTCKREFLSGSGA